MVICQVMLCLSYYLDGRSATKTETWQEHRTKSFSSPFSIINTYQHAQLTAILSYYPCTNSKAQCVVWCCQHYPIAYGLVHKLKHVSSVSSALRCMRLAGYVQVTCPAFARVIFACNQSTQCQCL